MKTCKWILCSEKLPSGPPHYEQVDVLFCCPGWACPTRGLFTMFLDGTHEWSMYDAINDRFVEWTHEPTHWMYMPDMPKLEEFQE